MQNTKGFTLIELLVIISITIIMTVAVFSDYGKNNDIFALERSSQKLGQDLRRVQEMSISGFGGNLSTTGYGISFNSTAGSENKYLVYEEKNASMLYDPGVDEVKETVNVETGIKICTITDNATSTDHLSISFEPPNPITYVEGVYSGHEAAIILCMISDETQTRTVKVNNVGRVEVTK